MSAEKHHIMDGKVWHRRLGPVTHGFSYGLRMLLVDLDDLDGLYRRSIWIGAGWRPLSLRSRDFIDHSSRPLAGKVRRKAKEMGLDFTAGRVLMLAQPRGLGWQFNPLVLYWFIPEGKTHPDALLAEVRNTPWHERHWYALAKQGGGALTFFRHDKAFHVSPFLGMDMEYQWELDWDDPLRVRLSVLSDGEPVFEAGFRLAAQPLHQRNVVAQLPGLLFQGVRTSLGIYWQAFRLWRKKLPFYRHPAGSVSEGGQ